MRPLPRLLIGFTAVVFANLAARASETLPTSNAEPKIVIRCDVAKGVILKQVTPVYPAEARTKSIQGLVRISVRVNRHGVPEKLRVLSGPPELVRASLDAVKQWRYKPYKLNGKAVPVETSIDIKYVIPRKRPVRSAPEVNTR
jgi:TonB family protein